MNNRLPPLRRGGISGQGQLPAIQQMLQQQNQAEQQQGLKIENGNAYF